MVFLRSTLPVGALVLRKKIEVLTTVGFELTASTLAAFDGATDPPGRPGHLFVDELPVATFSKKRKESPRQEMLSSRHEKL